MKEIRVFDDETWLPADVEPGERVAVVRAGGPRDGATMFEAIVRVTTDGFYLEPVGRDAGKPGLEVELLSPDE